MQIFKKILIALSLAFMATAILTATTVIVLMFTGGQEIGHHVGLFGSVFFDAHETNTGSIMVGVGVENPWVLTLIFLVIFAVSLVFLTVLSALRRRKELLERHASNAIE